MPHSHKSLKHLRTQRELRRERAAAPWRALGLGSPGHVLRELRRQVGEVAAFAEIGELTIGLMHELNNPISCLRANLALCASLLSPGSADGGARGLRQPPDLGAALQGPLEEMAFAVDLVSSISRGLRALATGDVMSPERVDVRRCIEVALRVVDHQIRSRVTVRREFEPTPEVLGFPGLLTQVFLNLFVNAAHAIDGPGTLTVRVGPDAGGVLIRVEDTGCGIPPGGMRRLFTPFFTTKPPGKGLGLGLVVCKDIVTRHKGRIWADSRPGSGTVVHIWLPTRDDE